MRYLLALALASIVCAPAALAQETLEIRNVEIDSQSPEGAVLTEAGIAGRSVRADGHSRGLPQRFPREHLPGLRAPAAAGPVHAAAGLEQGGCRRAEAAAVRAGRSGGPAQLQPVAGQLPAVAGTAGCACQDEAAGRQGSGRAAARRPDRGRGDHPPERHRLRERGRAVHGMGTERGSLAGPARAADPVHGHPEGAVPGEPVPCRHRGQVRFGLPGDGRYPGDDEGDRTGAGRKARERAVHLRACRDGR